MPAQQLTTDEKLDRIMEILVDLHKKVAFYESKISKLPLPARKMMGL